MPTIVKIVNTETLPEVQKEIADSVNEIIDTYDASEDFDDDAYVMNTVNDNIYIIENRMYSESDLESFLNKNYNAIYSVALYAKKVANQYKFFSAEISRKIIKNADSILNILETIPEEQEEEQLPLQEQLQEPKKRGFFSRLFGKKKGGKSKRRKTKTKTKNRKIRKNASTRTRRRRQ
jgi:hypothetical protein